MSQTHRGQRAGHTKQRQATSDQDASKTGYETAAGLMAAADADGRAYAEANVPPEKALANDAAPKQFIDGAIEQRKGDIKATTARAQTTAQERIKTVPPRKAEARTNVRNLKHRQASLPSEITSARTRAEESRRAHEHALDHWLTRIPPVVRGYFERGAIVASAAGAVAAFDAGIAHAVVEYAGFSAVIVWGTTLTVPLAVIGINHALGLLAGAIGERTPDDGHRQLAVMAFASAFLAALISFVLLMVFRAQAAHSQNEALQSLIDGDADATLTFFVSPLWMGPMQLAGSMAVIVLTALWTMAKPGREYKTMVLAPLKEQWETDVAAVDRFEQRLEQTTAELERAQLVEHQVEADGLAASAQIEQSEKARDCAVEAEDGNGKAAQARFEASYSSHDASPPWRVRSPKHANGNGKGHPGDVGPRIVGRR